MRSNLQVGDTEVSLLEVPAGGAPLRKICRTSAPSVEVLFPLENTVVVRNDNRDERVVRPDESIYLVGHRRYAVFSTQGGLALAVAVPLAAVDEYAGESGHVELMRGSALLAPVKKFLIGVMENHDELDRLPAYFIEKLVWEMVVSLMLESKGAASLTRPTLGMLDRAMAHIAAYRTDQTLTPVSLAQALNISMRQLQRVFAGMGSTPSREIRRQRADLAVSMLTNDAFRVLSITQVAHHSGFADAAELRRAFEAFGYRTPSVVRGVSAR
ncbi:helix-turn-helix domain-containing protein [Herbiconiux ginsengi]|uniref:Helix-turn-helix domain-containing protein n=1 Tax=Herbiconiux ginsengi TaxID=381665 RepID=A0A1H3U525_9MICO|nr:helix-turn-helix domain-containing protein [Herbiconiux ginsengi]SDZ57576.1 Helix-turn-helix domain-containing protein [Herbiconiux ginsengi]